MLNSFAISVAISAALVAPTWAQGPALDTARIEQAIGMKGTYNTKENVFKVTKLRPNTPAGNGEALVMGDNVLYEDEVGPAMDAALQNGLEVTAPWLIARFIDKQLGLSAVHADDHEILKHGMVSDDALYAWCRQCQAEAHNWPPSA